MMKFLRFKGREVSEAMGLRAALFCFFFILASFVCVCVFFN